MKKKLSIFLVFAVLIIPCLFLFTGCKDSSVVNVKVYIGETGYSFTNENPTLNFEYGETIDWSTAFSVKLVKKDGSEIDVEQGKGGYSVTDEDSVLTKESLPVGTYTITIAYGDFDPIKVTINVGKGVLAIPTVSGEYTYNGTEQTVSLVGFDENKMTTTNNKRTNAGTQDVVVSIVDTNSFVWADGTTDAKNISWTINKLSLERPTIAGEYIYNGEEQTAVLDGNFDASIMTVSNNVRKIVGTQSVVVAFKDKDNYMWTNGSSDEIYLDFEILKAMCPSPEQETIPSFSGTYSASKKQLKDYTLPAGYSWADENEFIYCDVKTYKAYYNTDSVNYRDRTVLLTIDLEKADILEISHPALTGTYDASTHLSNYALNEGFRWVNQDLVPRCDTTSYDAIYNPDSRNYNDKTLSITLVLSKAEAPSCVHAPRTIGYDETKTLADYVSFLNEHCTWKDENIVPTCNVNEYEVVYNPDPVNYTDRILTITITVTPKALSVPTLVGTYTYNGTSQTAVLDGVDATIMLVRNNTRMIAGTQNIIVTLLDDVNYCWVNGETEVLIPFTIETLNIAGAVVNLEYTEIEYTGDYLKPNIISVKLGDIDIYDTDYTVEYSNNLNKGTATVKVIGKNSTYGTITLTFEITLTVKEENVRLIGDEKVTLLEDTGFGSVDEALKNHSVGITYSNMNNETYYQNLQWKTLDGSVVDIHTIGTYTLYPVINGKINTACSVTLKVIAFVPVGFEMNEATIKQSYNVGDELEDFSNFKVKAINENGDSFYLDYEASKVAGSFYVETTFNGEAVGNYTITFKYCLGGESADDTVISTIDITVVDPTLLEEKLFVEESITITGYPAGSRLEDILVPIHGSYGASGNMLCLETIKLSDSRVQFVESEYDPYNSQSEQNFIIEFTYNNNSYEISGSIALVAPTVEYIVIVTASNTYKIEGSHLLPYNTTIDSYEVYVKYAEIDKLEDITSKITKVSDFSNFDTREGVSNTFEIKFNGQSYSCEFINGTSPTNTKVTITNNGEELTFDENNKTTLVLAPYGGYSIIIQPEKESILIWFAIEGLYGKTVTRDICGNVPNNGLTPITIIIMVQDNEQLDSYYIYVKEDNHINFVKVNGENYTGDALYSGDTIEVTAEDGYTVKINSEKVNTITITDTCYIDIIDDSTGTSVAQIPLNVKVPSNLSEVTINGNVLNLEFRNENHNIDIDRMTTNEILIELKSADLSSGIFAYEVFDISGKITTPRMILNTNQLRLAGSTKSVRFYYYDENRGSFESELDIDFYGKQNQYINAMHLDDSKENVNEVSVNGFDLVVCVNGTIPNLKDLLETIQFDMVDGYEFVSCEYNADAQLFTVTVKSTATNVTTLVIFNVVDTTQSLINLREFSIEGNNGYRTFCMDENGLITIDEINSTEQITIWFDCNGNVSSAVIYDSKNQEVYSDTTTYLRPTDLGAGTYKVVITLESGVSLTTSFKIESVDDTPAFEVTYNGNVYTLIFGGNGGVSGDFEVSVDSNYNPIAVYTYIGALENPSETSTITISIRTLFEDSLYFDKDCTNLITDLDNCNLSLVEEGGVKVAYIYYNEEGTVLPIKLICDNKPTFDYDIRFVIGETTLDFVVGEDPTSLGDFKMESDGTSQCLFATISASDLGLGAEDTTVLLSNLSVVNGDLGVCYNMGESDTPDEEFVLIKGMQFSALEVPVVTGEVNGETVRYVKFFISFISGSTPTSFKTYIILK